MRSRLEKMILCTGIAALMSGCAIFEKKEEGYFLDDGSYISYDAPIEVHSTRYPDLPLATYMHGTRRYILRTTPEDQEAEEKERTKAIGTAFKFIFTYSERVLRPFFNSEK